MKKLDVNQELCRKVQIMLAGAKSGEVAQLLGISKTTVSRIKMAGFDAEVYKKNTEKRVAEENGVRTPQQVLDVEETEHGIIVTDRSRMQQPGQISMDDLQAEEPPKEMSDQTKLMRFQAAQVDNVVIKLASIDAKESTINMSILKGVVELGGKLDKLNDNLCQILRKLDG